MQQPNEVLGLEMNRSMDLFQPISIHSVHPLRHDIGTHEVNKLFPSAEAQIPLDSVATDANTTRDLRRGLPRDLTTLTCNHYGCSVKFKQKKDRNRHFRQKHQANEGYRCPVVDCFMGTGHRIQRKDKLREHLRRKNDPTSQWACFLLGCSEMTIGKVGLMDHLGTHDRLVRLAGQQLMVDYGFLVGEIYPVIHYDKPPLGYLTCEYMCQIAGCPFGTNSSTVMKIHNSTPHQGPYCVCPMPDCDKVLPDWNTTAAHLARQHDAAQRKVHDKELLDQGFWWRSSVFTCPICKIEIKIMLNKVSCDEKIRSHCTVHSSQELTESSKELVQAFVLSNRRKLWYPRMPLLEGNDEQVFAYLTWAKEDLLKIWTMR
jgi:hypothetical protein